VFVDLGLTALTDRKPIAVNRDSFLDTFSTILSRDVYFPLGHLAAVNHHQGICQVINLDSDFLFLLFFRISFLTFLI
jgi:hypothetical protein